MLFQVLMLLLVAPARADMNSAIGGLDLGRDTRLNGLNDPASALGAEYALDLGPRMQVGGFYDNDPLGFEDGSGGSIRDGGLVARLFTDPAGGSSPYFFGKFGLAQRSEGERSSSNQPAFGGGFGYRYMAGDALSLGPRAETEFLPSSVLPGSPTEADLKAAFVFLLRF